MSGWSCRFGLSNAPRNFMRLMNEILRDFVGSFVIVYLDNHALQSTMQQPKLNLKHVKWVEFLQSFTFVLKHISGQSNKVADALSRRLLIVQENQIQVLGFEHLRDLYETDLDFQEAYWSCKNPVDMDREPWMDYALQYVKQQLKLNLKHVKWVEFLQIFTFVLKHISGQSNRVVDSLSRRLLIVQENQIQVMGFEHLRNLYETDIDF